MYYNKVSYLQGNKKIITWKPLFIRKSAFLSKLGLSEAITQIPVLANLRISLVNVTKSQETADLVVFTEKILNGKFHFCVVQPS